MAKQKKASAGKRERNDERKCGKARKKHPGVSPGAHNGKTIGGYTRAKLELREAARRLRDNLAA